MPSIRNVTAVLLASALFAGCATDDEIDADDGENDSFASGKADGGIDPDSVEAAGVLALLNTSYVDADYLVTEGGIARRGATQIFKHRDGADNRFGTADDDLFDTLAELDRVKYVGPVTLTKLVAFAESHGFTKRWSDRASMLEQRMYFGAVATGGRVFAVGGGGVQSSLEAYDPATNAWTAMAQMPTARHGQATALGKDGKIYAIGGYENSAARPEVAVVEAYTPSTNTWETLAPLPKPRSLISAATGPDGRIYVVGGYLEGSGTLSTLEIYNPATNTWAAGARMPSSRYTLATAFGDDGKLYAFGGTRDNTALATVEAYDPATNAWSRLPDMYPSREGATAFTGNDGRIYLVGGQTQNDFHPLASVSTYRASTKEWSGIQSMQLGRESPAAAQAPDGKIYVLGGYDLQINRQTSKVEAFTPP
jgi:N-acetylneuraminic acid mutarotase